MRRLGRVLHLSKGGNLILRLEGSQLPSAAASVCDYKLVKVGSINGILGPVKSPYVSIHPTMESPGTLKGRVLYLAETE